MCSYDFWDHKNGDKYSSFAPRFGEDVISRFPWTLIVILIGGRVSRQQLRKQDHESMEVLFIFLRAPETSSQLGSHSCLATSKYPFLYILLYVSHLHVHA